MKKLALICTLLIMQNAWGSAKEAYNRFLHDKSPTRDIKIASELIDGGFYYSAIPYINNYLENHSEIDAELEKQIELLVLRTGTMAILNIDSQRLNLFKIPSVSLVLGTRLFNQQQYKKSYEVLDQIPDTHIFSIESYLIKGTIKNLDKKYIEANNLYNKCFKNAEKQESKVKGDKLKRYYNYLKETCLIRTGRIQVEQKNYAKALEIYNQIDKVSYKWPYLILDKAWASYYLKDYNRTLGLTVTYKSPLLDTYFFPEAEVLTALSYYNLCLWDDAMLVVDNFYNKYQKQAAELKTILGQNRNSNTYFLDLYYADAETRAALNPFIKNLITQTRKQVKFNLDLASLAGAKEELKKIERLKNQNDFTALLKKNLEATVTFMSSKINFYIKKEIFQFVNEIHKHSYSMFNLKLELLSKKRDDLYTPASAKQDRERGGSQNIKRSTDQYFFDFNGSFWADELGDYSFGLESKCKE